MLNMLGPLFIKNARAEYIQMKFLRVTKKSNNGESLQRISNGNRSVQFNNYF